VSRCQCQCQSPHAGLFKHAWTTYPGALISLLMVWHVDMTYEGRGECHVLDQRKTVGSLGTLFRTDACSLPAFSSKGGR
jgi:hypothetical protein